MSTDEKRANETVSGANAARIERWIEPNPHIPGVAEAWVGEFGISVWALIGYLELMHGNMADVAEDYRIPPEALEAAVAYSLLHQKEIDARIAFNRAAFVA
ncbi:MAG: hypothetical protein ACR2PL_24795 [Dehalococcoidia bacterium]